MVSWPEDEGHNPVTGPNSRLGERKKGLGREKDSLIQVK